jgi:hypothetical protein
VTPPEAEAKPARTVRRRAPRRRSPAVEAAAPAA